MAANKAGGANVGDAMAAMGAVLGGANAGKKVEVVEFRVLKDMLPESLSGMNRTDATGEKNAAMGMAVSTANGSYQNDQGGSIQLKITDIGSMTGLVGMAAYAWAASEIDRETSTGYEKTTKFNGYKAHEKYDNSSKYGELSVLVGDRFVVESQGNSVDMNAIKDALGKVDLGKLDRMKNVGGQ
ncbi:MAG TPA: hypothetical protein VIF83_10595 [Gemmatimonadaceae bacterium]